MRPRCSVYALQNYGSDDPDKCPCRGEIFRPDWMNIRIRKKNAYDGSSPKNKLKFLPPLPIESIITKLKFQASEANASFAEDNNMRKIANDENGHDHNNNAIQMKLSMHQMNPTCN